MFQKFRANLENRKKVNQLKKKIKLAYELIYSEKYNLSEAAEQEKLILKVSGSNDPIQLLESFIIISRITKYSSPISENGIDDLRQELDNIKLKLSPSSTDLETQAQKANLELEKVKMSIDLIIRQRHITSGKAAFDKDPYSFEGMIYKLEKAGHSPISLSELEKLKSISDQLRQQKQKLEDIELEQKELNDEIVELKHLKKK